MKEDILNDLKSVNDPELNVNIVDLGLIYEVREKNEKEVYIKLTLTSPACPLGPQIKEEITKKLGEKGITVEIELTFDPPWGPDKMTDDAKLELGVV